MRVKKFDYYACDFETTVYKGQTFTEVWSSAFVPLYTEDVTIHHSIKETADYFFKLKKNVVLYYHNLKFDGAFWLDYLIRTLQFEQASYQIGQEENEIAWYNDARMKNKTFKYAISDRGMWYNIIIKVNDHFIELRDSYKLMPYSLKRIGEGFKTKHRKLEMEYEGYRYAGCEIKESEKPYIINDVLVLKEGLEYMFNSGHTSLTIGSCCMKEYKSLFDKKQFEAMFPNMYDVWIDEKRHGCNNAGEWLRHSYRGGYCYVVKGKENTIFHNGLTADVNSLYPFVMSAENLYPIGIPKFWTGNFIPDEALKDRTYFFIRVKTRFYIKKNMLPFIQIKGNFKYKGTENLESSDVYDRISGTYNSVYFNGEGKPESTCVELTFTMTEYYRFIEFYDLIDFEILDGCYFSAVYGVMKEYIDKYREIKEVSTGAKREEAKLFSNNLYGKFASNTDSSFKYAYIKEDGNLSFMRIEENDKTPGYIPIGSAITGYARDYTIRTAQKNYYGKNKRGFIYADTDSIHCDLQPEELKGIEVHPTKYGAWKLESSWDVAIFARQKTYIEHIVKENLKDIENPYYNIKGAGMPDRSKFLFETCLSNRLNKNLEGKKLSDSELEFIYDSDKKIIQRRMEDFKVGLCVPGKLMPKRIIGGIVLTETTFKMR